MVKNSCVSSLGDLGGSHWGLRRKRPHLFKFLQGFYDNCWVLHKIGYFWRFRK